MSDACSQDAFIGGASTAADRNAAPTWLQDLLDSERVSLTDLARFLGVNPATTSRWRASGRLEAFRVGGKWYASRRAVEKFLGGH